MRGGCGRTTVSPMAGVTGLRPAGLNADTLDVLEAFRPAQPRTAARQK